MEKHLQIYSRATAKKLGLTRYFTGKPCKSGHVVERRAASGACLECEKRWAKPKENTEKEKQRKRKWYEENKEKARLSSQRFSKRKSSIEKQKERHREWYEKNREEKMRQNKEWAKKNKSRFREYTKRWRGKNPHYSSVSNQKRRGFLENAEGRYSQSDLEDLFSRQKGRCAFCGCRISESGKKRYHADHVVPLAKGGSNWITNIQLLCKSCNLSKGAKDPVEWAQEKGKLL